MNETEKRDFARPVELRANGNTKVLRGYAYVFDALSHDLGGFRERIEPGAGARSLTGAELVATFNHDFSSPLARTGAGLRTGVDEVGGWYEIDLPNTTVGRDVAELVERGIVRGSSFIFQLNDYEADQSFTRTEDGELIRSLHDFTVRELGPVTNPAYPDTSVAMRSIELHVASESAPANGGAPSTEDREAPVADTKVKTDNAVEERKHVEAQLQAAADDNRPEVEARLLAVLDALDGKVDEQRAEQLTAEQRSVLLDIIGQHQEQQATARSAKVVDEAAVIRDMATGDAKRSLESRAQMGVKVDVTNKQTGKATPTKTLYTVLTELMVERSSVVAGGARVITTTGAEDIDFPRVRPAGAPTAPTEGQAFNEAYPETDVVTIGAKKYGSLAWLTWELVNDDMVDLVDYLVQTAGPDLADQANRDHITKLLAGVEASLVDDQSAVVAITDEAVADLVIDTSLAVPSFAEAKATWFAGRQVTARLRKLKDADGRYLLKSLAEGQGLTLVGRPFKRDVGMDANTSLVFSDLSGYIVRRCGSLRVDRSFDAKFSTDEIGYRFAMRESGGLVNTTGTALLKLPTDV
jgi:HK97 family phage major capsid protein/HK97 family phage prohead protease